VWPTPHTSVDDLGGLDVLAMITLESPFAIGDVLGLRAVDDCLPQSGDSTN
jgi:hypothetical protein